MARAMLPCSADPSPNPAGTQAVPSLVECKAVRSCTVWSSYGGIRPVLFQDPDNMLARSPLLSVSVGFHGSPSLFH